MKIKSYNEIRLDSKNELDDIAIENVHLERMNNSFWWLGLYRTVKDKRYKNGKKTVRTTFHITSRSKIRVQVIENDLKAKFVEQEV